MLRNPGGGLFPGQGQRTKSFLQDCRTFPEFLELGGDRRVFFCSVPGNQRRAEGFGPFSVTNNLVRQIEADILIISRGNSILVLSCSFKVSKCISECWPR